MSGSQTKGRVWKKEDFKLLKALGTGRFASVYQAVEHRSHATVALKEVKKNFILKHNFLHQLRREVEIQGRLHHPNIIKLFGYFEDKSSVYLVLECAEGGSLYNYLAKRRRLSSEEVKRMGFQLLSALHYLNERHIIHRDIKLENILLDEEFNPMLSDFGWSVHTPHDDLRATFCGTVLYLPPEMVAREEYSHKVDIWSLGVLLYELSAGQPPFCGEDNVETFELIQTKSLDDTPIDQVIQDANLKDLLRSVGTLITSRCSTRAMKTGRQLLNACPIFSSET